MNKKTLIIIIIGQMIINTFLYIACYSLNNHLAELQVKVNVLELKSDEVHNFLNSTGEILK
jgi:hypothetical protein